MRKLSFMVATLLIAGLASQAFAEDAKEKTEAKEKTGVKERTDAKEKTGVKERTDAKEKTEARGEKPKSSPGWVVLEEDWWYPFLRDFPTALHNARERYRAKEASSAGAEIDKAISWLEFAQDHADKSTAEDLSTARSDLMDVSAALKSGTPVLAKKLDAAFAHASLALARHHHFRSSKAVAEEDLKTAGRHLMAAADLLRSAAESANLEYGSEAVEIYDDYAPFGFLDETIVLEKGKVEANLAAVKAELDRLAAKLKAGRWSR